MTDETVKAISEHADNGIVASVWRSGNNLGMCFSKHGKTVTWYDMTEQERVEVVNNFYAAGDFFCRFIKTPNPKGTKVEQLT